MIIWQVSEGSHRWRDFPVGLRDYVEDKWQHWRGNGTPGYQFVVEYHWPNKKGDLIVHTPYEIVFETDGTITQTNLSTNFTRAVRRLVCEGDCEEA